MPIDPKEAEEKTEQLEKRIRDIIELLSGSEVEYSLVVNLIMAVFAAHLMEAMKMIEEAS